MVSGCKGAGLGLEADPDMPGPSAAFLAWFLGCVVIYGAVFATGYTLYGQVGLAVTCSIVAGLAAIGLLKTFPRIRLN